MLQQKKYISNPIIPQEVEARFGKKIVMENCGKYMDKNQNAGVVCNRITELNLNSRKKISNVRSDSSQMKDALNHSDQRSFEVVSSKKPLTSYSTYDNQHKFFETKLVPDMQGKMSICVGRKSGSATVNINIDEYDLERTYHTWKKIMGKSTPHTRSHLETDRFLTVSEDAERSDKLPVVKNRNPPYANPDGPFEKERLNLPKQARDNLDRTLTPRVINEKTYHLKVNNKINEDSLFLLRPHEEIIPDTVKGVRRTNFPWINSNRIKTLLNHNYEDEKEENNKKCEYSQNNNINEENLIDEQREINCNVSNNSRYGENNNNNVDNMHNSLSPNYKNVEYGEKQYSSLHNYKNRKNCQNQYNDGNQQYCSNQNDYENKQCYNNQYNDDNQQYYDNRKNHEDKEQYINQQYHNNIQNCNNNQNLYSQNNEYIPNFEKYDTNLNSSKCDYLKNENYGYNKGNDCCRNDYEYVNSTSCNKYENLNEQNDSYRAPSLTEIS